MQNAEQLLDTILELHPGHPHYLSLATSVYIWKSIFDGNHRPEYLVRAEQYALSAFSLRPTWSNSLTTLAKIDYYLGKNPSSWLALSEQFGNQETETYLTHVEVGFGAWDSLDSKRKSATINYLLRGAEHSRIRNLYVPIINNSPRKADICRYLVVTGRNVKVPCDD